MVGPHRHLRRQKALSPPMDGYQALGSQRLGEGGSWKIKRCPPDDGDDDDEDFRADTI